MLQKVLIIATTDTPYIGLWQPHGSQEWETYPFEIQPAGQENSLLAALEDFLSHAHVPLAQITHVGVMAGPGSYTKLRQGVATANALAWALEVPLFAFTPENRLPDDLPHLVSAAQVNRPVEPIYPHTIG